MGLSLKVSDNSLETQEFLESPRPLLSKSKENLLSARQKEAILGLEELIKEELYLGKYFVKEIIKNIWVDGFGGNLYIIN